MCRPDGQGLSLVNRLTEDGAQVQQLPAIEISPLTLSGEQRQKILDFDSYDAIIVISAHAANYLMMQLDQYWPQLPIAQRWFAIGNKTANVLSHFDIEAKQPISGIDSEALLDHPDFTNIAGQKILIARGVGGRDTLFEVLESRGAQCAYLELYERQCPNYPLETLQASLNDFSPQLYICLSQETLANLQTLANRCRFDMTAPDGTSSPAILVPGSRVAEFAKSQGFQHIVIPASLSESDQYEAIRHYFQALASPD